MRAIKQTTGLQAALMLACLLMTHFARAMSLLEAYDAALANDSVYRAALHDNEAGQQYKIIGRANLLPNVSASYAYNRINSDISASNINVTRNYNSENGAIQVRQPIVNLEGWARYKEGNLQTNLSDKQLAASKQELIKRFFGLYANANYAEDLLALSTAQRDALKNQEEANKLMSAKGEGTKTALIESQAQLSLAEAQLLEAQDAVADARNELAAMLGKEVANLDTLSDSFAVQPLTPTDFEAWKTIALDNNPDIAAQRESVALAQQEIQRNRAGHMPRLDAIASLSKSKSETTSTFNQEIDNQSIGLQLNIPIYAGGSVSALTTQAVANYQKAQAELDTKTNTVLVDLRKQLGAVQNSQLKIDALKQSVAAAELLITATKKSQLGGVRTNLDLLDARKHLFEAKRDLSLARYNYLVALINLKKAAGTLTVADIEKIAPYFTPQPSSALGAGL
jgi:outer membrane protein, protease secretion system